MYEHVFSAMTHKEFLSFSQERKDSRLTYHFPFRTYKPPLDVASCLRNLDAKCTVNFDGKAYIATRQCTCNVTMRRLCETIVALE